MKKEWKYKPNTCWEGRAFSIEQWEKGMAFEDALTKLERWRPKKGAMSARLAWLPPRLFNQLQRGQQQ